MSDDDRYRRFNLRIPKELFAQLQEQADVRSHSMNAEIVQRLEDSLVVKNPAEDTYSALTGFNRITNQLNLLTAAILQEERMLNLMLERPESISPTPTSTAIEFQKIRIDTLRANYLALIKEAGLKVDPKNILKLIWD